MKKFENYESEDGFYGTGRTAPPKSRSGLLAVLLIVLIFAGGIVSMLGLLKIRLFLQVASPAPTEASPLAFSALSGVGRDMDVIQPAKDGALQMDIADTPQTVENIPVEGGLSLQEIYSRSIASVVSITCSREDGTSTGTGVILSSDGYIVTNCHVVRDARTIWVRFSDRRELTAVIVGTDAMSDLAVLHVDSNALQPAQFGDSDSVRVGDVVVAIGDPLGAQLSGTMTDGIISAINRDITVGGRTMTLLQTNAALNAGNSGGPLINCYGQVIGINTMKLVGSDTQTTVEGLGFAIPSRTVKEIVDQLLTQGYVSGRPTLGVSGQKVTGLYQRYYNWPEGFYVTGVAEDGAAEKAGILPGDIITQLAGIRVTDPNTLAEAVYTCQAGDRVVAVVCRNGKYYNVMVTIGAVE